MRNITLTLKMIDPKKKVILLQVNLLPEFKNIENSKTEILKFINKYKRNYTFLTPSFTKRFFFRNGKLNYFHKKKECTNGYFANFLINSKLGYRANHSTHSYYFIGKKARELSNLSKVNDGPFEIFHKIGISNISFININFKGVPTFHLAENKLGYSKNILSNFLGSYYKNNKNKIIWNKLKFLNGCDKKYDLLTNKYIKKKLIFLQKFKNSIIYYGELAKIWEKDLIFMRKNKSFFNCNNCFYCKFISASKLNIFFNIIKNYKIFFSILINIITKKNGIQNYHFK